MLKHGILGLLNYCDMTGYEIRTAFRASLNHFWQAQTSQIYRELQALENSGWITAVHVEQKGKPDKNILSITDEGRKELLRWLETNKPDYEPVLSHGDLCLPNIFIDGDRVSGLIDLGACSIGDRWRDIALCYRSLRWNAEGAYGGKVYPDVKSQMLFDALSIEPDLEKIRYYILMDELF